MNNWSLCQLLVNCAPTADLKNSQSLTLFLKLRSPFCQLTAGGLLVFDFVGRRSN